MKVGSEYKWNKIQNLKKILKGHILYKKVKVIKKN